MRASHPRLRSLQVVCRTISSKQLACSTSQGEGGSCLVRHTATSQVFAANPTRGARAVLTSAAATAAYPSLIPETVVVQKLFLPRQTHPHGHAVLPHFPHTIVRLKSNC